MTEILSTLIVQKSLFLSLCAIQIYMIGETKYYLSLVSENIFSAALPFYQSLVFIAIKHKNYCAAKKLQNEVNSNKQFFIPSFRLIIIV